MVFGCWRGDLLRQGWRGAVSVGAGGGLLAAVRSGRVYRLCSLWAAGSSVRRWRCCWCRSALAGGAGGRGDLLRRRGAGGIIDRAGPSLIRTDPAGDPVQRAGSRASGGKMGKRKRPGQTARRALLLWPLVCTGGNGSGWVRPGAGGWRYTRVFCPLYPGRPGCT